MPGRYVLDTNVVISGILFPDSVPSRALRRAQTGEILASDSTKLELITTLDRPRFDRYLEASVRRALASEYVGKCEPVAIGFPIRACRDPRDDKFLEVAVHGRADVIITGDQDLLALHPFKGIAIITPAALLEMPVTPSS